MQLREIRDQGSEIKELFMRSSPIVAMLALAAPALLAAQGAQPVTQSLRSSWDGAKKNIVESADVMPEADYGFKPVDGVRTFGQILGHLAGANYVICSAAKGEKPPHAENAFEKLPTKAAIVKALGESMAYCDGAMGGLDDRKLGETIEMPFGMGKAARASAIVLNIGHLNEHYGNLVTYFRIKGIVPPSSR
jgi:DinB superfamily